MTTLIINSNQKPPNETIIRLKELRDEDIIYDEDSPRLTPKMEDSIKQSIKQNMLKTVNK